MAKRNLKKTRVQVLEEALQELIDTLSLTDIDEVSGNEVTMEVPENATEEQLEAKITSIITAVDESDNLPIIRPEDEFSAATQNVIDELKERLKAPAKEVDLSPYDMEDIIEDIEVAEELPELVAIANKYEEFGNMVGYIGSYKKFEVLKEAMLMELKKGEVKEDAAPASKETPKAEKEKPVKEKATKKEKPVKEPVMKVVKEKDVQLIEDDFLPGISINPKFKAACPELTAEELKGLEELILKDGKILNPAIVWQGHNQLVDGHNRYEIAKKNGLEFPTIEKEFTDENAVVLWIKENAIAQRNLTDFQKYELAKEIEDMLSATGKKKQAEKGSGKASRTFGTNAKTEKAAEKHNTREELSKKIGVSGRQIAKAKVIAKEAPEEVKEEVRKGKKTIGKAYDEVKKDKPKKTNPKNDNIKLKNASRELRLWIQKYKGIPVVEEFIDPVIDVVGNIDAKIKDLE